MYVQEHMEDNVEEESGWFYGVANGRDRFNGVLMDYPTAKELVDRISGAIWKMFLSNQDAFLFVQRNRKDARHKSPSPPRSSYKERGGSK